MVLPGETIGHLVGTNLEECCELCNKPFELKVCRSGAGYYIGTQCCLGPNSRESGYYNTRDDAETALKKGFFGR